MNVKTAVSARRELRLCLAVYRIILQKVVKSGKRELSVTVSYTVKIYVHFFKKGLFSIWPLSPLLFRFTDFIKKPFDLLTDYSLNGGEIHVIARRSD